MYILDLVKAYMNSKLSEIHMWTCLSASLVSFKLAR